MTDLRPDPSTSEQPQTVEALIPVVADVIQHTRILQKQAGASLSKVDNAAARLDQSAADLRSLQAEVTESVSNAVETKFAGALSAAGSKLSKPLSDLNDEVVASLSKVKEASEKAAEQLDKASKEAAKLLVSQAKAVTQSSEKLVAEKWSYVVSGGLVGCALGVLLTIVYFRT